ncbi:MAG: hypothetical protein P4L84_20985 [Isosphaeraceae bacterium]|nr:hypothetical protein [Isosphaeraceae bacterium]
MSASARGQAFKFQAEPVFRLGKQPADNVADGAIFLWTNETGRPVVALQAFLVDTGRDPGGLWAHEFTSLALGPVTATRKGRVAWSPTRPGMEFRSMPEAPRPAESVSQRLRQMRELAQGFRAFDNFKGKGWSELRMLATPIARYGKAGSDPLDGALFPFVMGTDPEVFLFLEVKPGNADHEWQYALAPMTVFEVKATYHDKPIWSLPDRSAVNGPSRPFYTSTDTR